MGDARISRESAEVLVESATEARLSRESLEVITAQTPLDARLSRIGLEVLISETLPSIESWGYIPI